MDLIDRMNKKFFTKLTHKNGISLITLVITIVVVIILSAAVVMSLNNNNVVTNASSARYEADRDTVQSYLEYTLNKISMKHHGTISLDCGKIEMLNNLNVSNSIGEITWKSTDIGNLYGEIIFDEGIDTDTTFYTGYKLPVYGSKTDWYVDENGKLVLKVGSRIYGSEEVPKTKITASNVERYPERYYGRKVNYKVDGISEYNWLIFYAEANNIFLIPDDYVKVEDLPENKNGIKPQKGNSISAVYFSNIVSNGVYGVPDRTKWLNQKYYDAGINKDTYNMAVVSYLLNDELWNKKFVNEKAEYAVGAPSVELLFKSYNNKNKINLYTSRVDSVGYLVSFDAGKTWWNNCEGENRLKDNENLYRISSTKNAWVYWLSSPYQNGVANLYAVHRNGQVYGIICDNNSSIGIRPVVCLKKMLYW